MTILLEKLEQLLGSELEAHTTLLTSARAFNSALKEENVEAVDRQRVIHDETVCRIEKLEEQRIECCSALAGTLGIKKKPLRMAMLLEKLPQEWQRRLGVIQGALKNRINELSPVSVSNRILLEEGLSMVGHTFMVLQQAGNRYGAYGKRGQSVTGPGIRSLFNHTV